MSESRNITRKDVAVISFWMLWIFGVLALGFFTSCAEQKGEQDASIQVDTIGERTHDYRGIWGEGDTVSDSAMDNFLSADGSAETDSISVDSVGNSDCPMPSATCAIAINPNPQEICVSPTQGPYVVYFQCPLEKRICCIPNINTNSKCEFISCLAI